MERAANQTSATRGVRGVLRARGAAIGAVLGTAALVISVAACNSSPAPSASATTGSTGTTGSASTASSNGSCSSAASVTICAVTSKNDATDSQWEIALSVDNTSGSDYTIVPGTDITLVGTDGQSLNLLGNVSPTAGCWGSGTGLGTGPSYSVATGKTLQLPTLFCFPYTGSFAPSNVQIQGSTPDTYTIQLG
jgi:hypothetical protein